MSATALRLATIPLALSAFGLRLAVTFWWMPLTWRITSPAQSIVLTLAGSLVAMAIPFGIYLLIALRARRRLADFQIRRGSFVAHSAAIPRGALSIMLMFLTGGLLLTERVPNADAVRLAHLPFALPVSIASVAVFTGLAALVLFYDRPRAILTAGALTVKGLRTLTVRWDDLASGGPNWPSPGSPRALLLHRNPVPGAHPVPVVVPIWRIHIDPAFLAHSIRHYVEHPQDRAGIGTDNGLRHLRATVQSPDLKSRSTV